MAESEGAAASVEGEQAMNLKALVVGGTGAVGKCLVGELLSSKVIYLSGNIHNVVIIYNISKIGYEAIFIRHALSCVTIMLTIRLKLCNHYA